MLLSVRLFRALRGGLLCAVGLSLAVAGQAANLEVSGTGGGLTMNGGLGTHSLVGGQVGVRFGFIQVFGEGSWSQLLSATQQGSTGGVTTTATGAAKVANFGGGAEYSFGTSKRFAPYAVTAVGVGHFYATGSGSSSTGVSVTVSLPIANLEYFGVGGGVRVYAGKHWGFKPEVRYQRYNNSLYSANAATYTVGLFWRFGD